MKTNWTPEEFQHFVDFIKESVKTMIKPSKIYHAYVEGGWTTRDVRSLSRKVNRSLHKFLEEDSHGLSREEVEMIKKVFETDVKVIRSKKVKREQIQFPESAEDWSSDDLDLFYDFVNNTLKDNLDSYADQERVCSAARERHFPKRTLVQLNRMLEKYLKVYFQTRRVELDSIVKVLFKFQIPVCDALKNKLSVRSIYKLSNKKTVIFFRSPQTRIGTHKYTDKIIQQLNPRTMMLFVAEQKFLNYRQDEIETMNNNQHVEKRLWLKAVAKAVGDLNMTDGVIEEEESYDSELSDDEDVDPEDQSINLPPNFCAVAQEQVIPQYPEIQSSSMEQNVHTANYPQFPPMPQPIPQPYQLPYPPPQNPIPQQNPMNPSSITEKVLLEALGNMIDYIGSNKLIEVEGKIMAKVDMAREDKVVDIQCVMRRISPMVSLIVENAVVYSNENIHLTTILKAFHSFILELECPELEDLRKEIKEYQGEYYYSNLGVTIKAAIRAFENLLTVCSQF